MQFIRRQQPTILRSGTNTSRSENSNVNNNLSVQDSELGSDIPQEIMEISIQVKLKNVSIINFSTFLLKTLFTEEKLLGRNCKGVRGKHPLFPLKLGIIKKCVFAYNSVPKANQEKTWRDCIKAIDEIIRRPSKKRYVEKSSSN